jgi:hypothetical protein
MAIITLKTNLAQFRFLLRRLSKSLITPIINIDDLTLPALNVYAFLYGEGIGSLPIDVYNNASRTTDVLVLEGQKQTSTTTLVKVYGMNTRLCRFKFCFWGGSS